MVGAPPGDPDPERSDVGLGCGASQATKQSCMVAMNCKHDLTDDMQNDTSCENCLAGMLASAVLPDNQCSALLTVKKDDLIGVGRLQEQS